MSKRTGTPWLLTKNPYDRYQVIGNGEIVAVGMNKADGTLIAAAPKLLAALKAIVDHCRRKDELTFEHDLITDAVSAIVNAEAN